MKRLFPGRPLNETRLLHEVGVAFPELDLASLSHEVLAQITAERGIDFATALFYDRVRRSPENGPFIAELESLRPDLDALPRLAGKLLVAPGAFYREHPETGADGWLVREIGAEFGMKTEVAPVPSGGSVAGSAEILRRALAAEPEGSVVLVSVSKGGADARMALEGSSGQHSAARRAVRLWVQICGLVRGTPVADAMLRWGWKRALLRAHFAYRRWDIRMLRELCHGPGSLLAAPTVPAAPGSRLQAPGSVETGPPALSRVPTPGGGGGGAALSRPRRRGGARARFPREQEARLGGRAPGHPFGVCAPVSAAGAGPRGAPPSEARWSGAPPGVGPGAGRLEPGAAPAGRPTTPPGVPVINVLGFPLTPHLTADARARHRLLAPMGPNDGSALLRDQILEPGRIYPLWGADHYFRVPDLSPLLYRLFLYLAREGQLAEHSASRNSR